MATTYFASPLFRGLEWEAEVQVEMSRGSPASKRDFRRHRRVSSLAPRPVSIARTVASESPHSAASWRRESPALVRALKTNAARSVADLSATSDACPAYKDGNGCLDWENPNNIISLLRTANEDPNVPVETFIVGVPGADTYDATGKNFPPYHMRLALSAMTYAGSPKNVPSSCTGTTYTQTGADPTVPCHFDMTVPGRFSTTAFWPRP